MKFDIKQEEDERREKTTFLRLRKAYGTIQLMAKRGDVEEAILQIDNEDGMIRVCSNRDKALGFELDVSGAVKQEI